MCPGAFGLAYGFEDQVQDTGQWRVASGESDDFPRPMNRSSPAVLAKKRQFERSRPRRPPPGGGSSSRGRCGSVANKKCENSVRCSSDIRSRTNGSYRPEGATESASVVFGIYFGNTTSVEFEFDLCSISRTPLASKCLAITSEKSNLYRGLQEVHQIGVVMRSGEYRP